MSRVSNTLITILNIISLVASLLIIADVVYTRVQGHTECHRLMRNFMIIFGASLFVISVLGLIGACGQVTVIMWIYLFLVMVMIIGVVLFTIFGIIVTNRGVGKAVSGKGFHQYRLGDYSNWLQEHVVSGENWYKVKACLSETKLCSEFARDFPTAKELYKHQLSPIQSGCCKPPAYCGFIFNNATSWEVPKSGPEAQDSDCLTWSNDQTSLCYDCKSCKVGVLYNFRNNWKKIAYMNATVFVILCIIHSVALCAYKNSKYNRYKFKGGYY